MCLQVATLDSLSLLPHLSQVLFSFHFYLYPSLFFVSVGGVDTNPTASGGVRGVFTGSEGEAQQGAVQRVCVPAQWVGWPCTALVPPEGETVDGSNRACGTSQPNL